MGEVNDKVAIGTLRLQYQPAARCIKLKAAGAGYNLVRLVADGTTHPVSIGCFAAAYIANGNEGKPGSKQYAYGFHHRVIVWFEYLLPGR